MSVKIILLFLIFGKLYAEDNQSDIENTSEKSIIASYDCLIATRTAEECCKLYPSYHENLRFRNPDNCNSYMSCINQEPIVVPCPELLHFSTQSTRCEWPNIADCDKDSASNIRYSCRDGSEPAEECCKGVPKHYEVRLKNPLDCSTFYQCIDEKPYLRPCPEDMKWSVNLTICHWQLIAQCRIN